MPVKNFTPFPVLKTERLILRQLQISDDNEVLALRSSDEVNKYLNRMPAKSIDDARSFIEMITDNIQRNDSIFWAITSNSTDKLIGTICMFNFSVDNSSAEIGYELLPSFQGKRFMLEAALKVIRFALENIGLHSIEACTHSENQALIRLLQKLHFEKVSDAGENCIMFQLKING